MSEELPDIEPLWQDDLVAFTIGCSFSFEQAPPGCWHCPQQQRMDAMDKQ